MKPTPSITTPSATHEAISERAYQIWLQTGQPHGEDSKHWLQAERELHVGNPLADDRARGGSVEPSTNGKHLRQVAPHSSDYVHPGVTTDSLHHHRSK